MTTTAPAPLVSIRNLQKSYRVAGGQQRTVLSIAALDLEAAGEIGLAGKSGSGKSTLINIISGITKCDHGQVRIGDFDMATATESDRDAFRARHIGVIHQAFNLLQGLTLLENIQLAMSFAGIQDGGRAKELLDRVGLSSRAYDRPSQLSIGQQQRVAVARALANKPMLLIADEPTGSLDPETAEEALGLIRETARESNATLLVVSHDRAVLRSLRRMIDLREINGAAL